MMRLATFLKVVPFGHCFDGRYLHISRRSTAESRQRLCEEKRHWTWTSAIWRAGRKMIAVGGLVGGRGYYFVNISDRVFGKLQTKALRKLKKKLPSGVSGFLGPGPSSPRGLC